MRQIPRFIRTHLASSCTTNDAERLASVNVKVETLEHERQARSIGELDVLKLDLATRGPLRRWLGVRQLARRLLLEVLRVVVDALERADVVLDFGRLPHEPTEGVLNTDDVREDESDLRRVEVLGLGDRYLRVSEARNDSRTMATVSTSRAPQRSRRMPSQR